MYTFTKLHDRRIPNVGVGVRLGVGPVEFQLYGSWVWVGAPGPKVFKYDVQICRFWYFDSYIKELIVVDD